ncbi:M16 family metallopeptidase [Campylobacter geochelonis]|uniref:Putative zinc protease n=1 Tax=Campylobacter geochelonis TaxID=1780362 RepID=A0A128EDC6_9BACT|nr:M16 family metallopeptidase [Campylobacter geochelonis]QKF70920.1 zinc-dependent peptidase, M16 family [Campylobacter geochelonis]CZE46964.1 putative zinc protease [Campylobacter geochelonis]
MKKILLIIFFSVFCFGLENDKNLISGELDNGLKYYLYQNQTPKNSINLILNIKAGSTDENENERGIAHFVEHMAFNGTDDFDKNELIKELESLGVKFGADLNAATSFDRTYYTLTIKNDDKTIKKALKVISNLGFKVKFNKDDLEAEKGVIVSEEKSRKNALTRISDQSLPYYFKDSIYAKRLPIGDMDVVRGATPKLMRGFYIRYYQPKNAYLAVVGDFNESKMQALIKESLSDIKGAKPAKKIEKNIGFFNKLVVFNPNDKEITNSHIKVFFEANASVKNSYKEFENDYKDSFISELFGLMNDSRRAKNESLLSTNFFAMNLYNKKELNGFYTNVINDDFNASLKDAFSLIKQVSEFGFDKGDFESVKSSLLSQNKTNYDRSKSRDNHVIMWQILSFLNSQTTFLSPQDSYEMGKKIISSITLEELNSYFKKIVSSKGVLVEIVSKEPVSINKDDILKIQKNATAKKSEEKKLPTSLLSTNLKVKKPINSSVDKKNLVYFYEFENGAKVIFKQIDTKKDNIVFNAVKKGGFSNIDDLKMANFAINLSNGSGIGKFNDYEVSKITAAQMFNYSKFINKTSLGYSGSSSIKDLENLLKALYVDFSSPKIDSTYFSVYQKLAIDALKTNEQNPEYKFAKEFNDFFYKNSQKMKFADENDIKNMNLKKQRAFLNDNYKNAGEYYFIFVGDMKSDDFIKIAQKYIGNLKGEKKIGEILDDGVKSIDGKHKFKRNYLQEDVSKTTIYIKTDKLKFSPKNAISLDLATEVLNTLMREKIREKDGMVYGIYADSKIEKEPFKESFTQISFTSDVENVDKIVKNVKQLIGCLKSDFKDEKELESIKKIKQVQLEKSYQNPNFWLNMLTTSAIYNEHIFSYDEYINLINSVTLKDIKDIVNLAFDLDNFIISTLEKK